MPTSNQSTPLDTVREHFPWHVSDELEQVDLCQALRAYGDWVATGGHGLPAATLQRARDLVLTLRQRDAVLEYDGVGITLRARNADDGDLLVRDNAHTTLTEDGRMIWRFQHVDP